MNWNKRHTGTALAGAAIIVYVNSAVYGWTYMQVAAAIAMGAGLYILGSTKE